MLPVSNEVLGFLVGRDMLMINRGNVGDVDVSRLIYIVTALSVADYVVTEELPFSCIVV